VLDSKGFGGDTFGTRKKIERRGFDKAETGGRFACKPLPPKPGPFPAMPSAGSANRWIEAWVHVQERVTARLAVTRPQFVDGFSM
jgi:hypothetical protein